MPYLLFHPSPEDVVPADHVLPHMQKQVSLAMSLQMVPLQWEIQMRPVPATFFLALRHSIYFGSS